VGGWVRSASDCPFAARWIALQGCCSLPCPVPAEVSGLGRAVAPQPAAADCGRLRPNTVAVLSCSTSTQATGWVAWPSTARSAPVCPLRTAIRGCRRWAGRCRCPTGSSPGSSTGSAPTGDRSSRSSHPASGRSTTSCPTTNRPAGSAPPGARTPGGTLRCGDSSITPATLARPPGRRRRVLGVDLAPPRHQQPV
jgi:hypothetical protein